VTDRGIEPHLPRNARGHAVRKIGVRVFAWPGTNLKQHWLESMLPVKLLCYWLI